MSDFQKACECCDVTRDSPGHLLHCPSCSYCGARLIWRIQRLRRPETETKDRCRTVLADWMRLGGHAEAEIRRLAKLPNLPIKPLPEKKKAR